MNEASTKNASKIIPDLLLIAIHLSGSNGVDCVLDGADHIVDFKTLQGLSRTRTRTNTNPNDTEANAAGRSGNARALRKQSKCGVHHEGEGHWPKFSQKL